MSVREQGYVGGPHPAAPLAVRDEASVVQFEFASQTLMVNVLVPVPLGVPLTTAPDSESPVGKVPNPPTMLHV
jgi:hypothetical protein